MAESNRNASYTLPEAHLHPHPIAGHQALARVAEPPAQYRTPVQGEEWPRELRRIELRALRAAASGQFSRLLQLANLLCQPAPADRPADELASCAREIREATNALEDIFHTILDPLTEEPEPGGDGE